MKKLNSFFLVFLLAISFRVFAQETIYPVAPHKGLYYIIHAHAHIGNGQILDNAIIEIKDDKIQNIGPSISVPGGSDILDAQGKEVYPGLILPNCNLGLQEIANGVRGSNDFEELGDYNPSVKSILAYNSASKIINILRGCGILIAHVVPQGGLIEGTSSVVQLDAWNYEDAAYKTNIGMHFQMPSLIARPARFGGLPRTGEGPVPDPIKEGLEKIENVKKFFREAKAYLNEPVHANTNLKFQALKDLFDKKEKFYVHCDIVKEMLIALDFPKEFGFDMVIVGGSESYQIAPILKENHVSVILSRMHALPTMQDDDIDQPNKTPAVLQKAGVLFAINDDFEETRFRNLAFNAGTAAAYGLSKEEALTAITLNAARILGIEDKTGSLEVGKDANLVISAGDILDMKSSIITDAFIQGRKIPLEDKQKQLSERYKYKYGLK